VLGISTSRFFRVSVTATTSVFMGSYRFRWKVPSRPTIGRPWRRGLTFGSEAKPHGR
jgi:hypothetical protein